MLYVNISTTPKEEWNKLKFEKPDNAEVHSPQQGVSIPLRKAINKLIKKPVILWHSLLVN